MGMIANQQGPGTRWNGQVIDRSISPAKASPTTRMDDNSWRVGIK